MKIKFLITSTLLAGSICCLAQEVKYRHVISTTVSLLRIGHTSEGNSVPGGIFLNYDYIFRNSASGFWSAQAGIGVFGLRDYYHGYAVPTVLAYNWGKRQKFFQLGLAGHYINEYFDSGAYPQGGSYRDQSYFVGPQLGYKRIRPKGYYFGTSLGLIMPVFTTHVARPAQYGGSPYTGTTLVAHISVSFGWAIKKRE